MRSSFSRGPDHVRKVLANKNVLFWRDILNSLDFSDVGPVEGPKARLSFDGVDASIWSFSKTVATTGFDKG